MGAVFHCILGFIIVQPWLRRRIVDREDLPWYTIFYTPCVAAGQYGYRTQDKMEMKPQPQPQMMPMQQPQMMPMQQPQMMPMQQMPYGFPGAAMPMNPYGMPVMGAAFGNDQGVEALGKALAPGFYQENVGAKREEEAGMHAAAFQTDDIVEELFKFLQLTSCCFFSMSHGANDVANAVGPFAAVWMIYSTGKIEKKADVDIWILIYGGIALDIGLLTMGHGIITCPSAAFITGMLFWGVCSSPTPVIGNEIF